MKTIKRTLTDHNFYVGVVVGAVVLPWAMGRKHVVNVKVPSQS